MRRSQSKSIDNRTLNLRDPRNLEIKICRNLKERIKSLTFGSHSQCSNSRSLCLNNLQPQYSSADQSFPFKRSTHLPKAGSTPRITFVANLIRTFSSIDEKCGSSLSTVPNPKPIKSQVYGDLTCQEAAEIIINNKGQFQMLKHELRVSGLYTTFGAQQVLLRSHLQARFNEIDARWREEQERSVDDKNVEAEQLVMVDDSPVQASYP